MVSHGSLSDNKFPQVSRTLPSITVDINNAVVWMVSTRPLISKPSSLCTNSLLMVPSAQITIGISVTFMFYSFFSSLASSRYLSLFSSSFSFTQRMGKFTIRPALFFCWLLLGLFVWPRFSDRFLPQNPWEVCASHFPRRIQCCEFTICFVWSNNSFTFRLAKFKLILTPLEFFISVLADVFSLEFEWQQVSSSLQDSSQDSDRS